LIFAALTIKEKNLGKIVHQVPTNYMNLEISHFPTPFKIILTTNYYCKLE